MYIRTECCLSLHSVSEWQKYLPCLLVRALSHDRIPSCAQRIVVHIVEVGNGPEYIR